MKGWILDTNVLSELRKPRCSPQVRAWVSAQPDDSLFVSCVTFAEIRFGIERLAPDEAFRRALTEWLDRELRGWFAGRVLDIDEAVVLAWRRMVEDGRARRHTFPQPDLFIAATAQVHGLGIATRNTGDFLAAGIEVLNPWDPR
ncbi:type II toxin-antitoxin system VapC family toxin [Paracraurococcus lichenis]|uniref:Ribonuclease VapC n=1 Tax=Paracraurococcus lichenis TaxID=3064888 RepID=A0ABT9DTX6_9PROT|nr:type II toxin-antitoxin system VapC family toxin [Paracraurococcus sp. LOR1-02]MDO9707356.1 type II toxin-antitoxin system VapC family toxin [Paracraurococcus sp. LOR1-02]